MPIPPFKKGVAEGCLKVILDISSKAGHNCEINEHLSNSAAAAWQHTHANPYRPA